MLHIDSACNKRESSSPFALSRGKNSHRRDSIFFERISVSIQNNPLFVKDSVYDEMPFMLSVQQSVPWAGLDGAMNFPIFSSSVLTDFDLMKLKKRLIKINIKTSGMRKKTAILRVRVNFLKIFLTKAMAKNEKLFNDFRTLQIAHNDLINMHNAYVFNHFHFFAFFSS